MNLEHGADVEEMAEKYHKKAEDIIDFSSNINPYKPEKLEEYVLGGIQRSYNYPDIHYRRLRKNIADYLNCKEEHVIPGNGATEIISLVMKCIKGPIGIIGPTFSEYERYATLNQIKVVPINLHKENGFMLDKGEIKNQIDKFSCLFLCNPNNPTGKVQNIKDILEFLERYQKLLIVDETFIEFTGKEEEYSLIKYIETYQNLIIIRAATKFFGLPGIRLGYGVTSHEVLLDKMRYLKDPWSVNTIAEHLAGHIFSDKEYIIRSKKFFQKERKRMLKELSEIKELYVYETDANFILMELKSITAEILRKRLFKKYDLLIRDASQFPGLSKYFIRVAVRTSEENDRLIQCLKEELHQGHYY